MGYNQNPVPITLERIFRLRQDRILESEPGSD